MIEIEEPPDIQACAEHAVPLAWLWSPRSGTWKAWEPVSEDPELMRRHRCEAHGDPMPAWRHLERQHPSTIHAGAALVRAELAKSQEQQQREGDPS